jgi:hypothetical protein
MTERDFQGIDMDEALANAALATRNIDAAFGNYGILFSPATPVWSIRESFRHRSLLPGQHSIRWCMKVCCAISPPA